MVASEPASELSSQCGDDPVERFRQWLADAERSEPNDPNAVCLATATRDGRASARMVLLKAVDESGFVFYTNLESRKGRELAENAWASLCFHWKSRRRQVRVEGAVEPVSEVEADAYFATRARVSQIGAWASKQSQPLRGRFELEARVARYAARYALNVPRPPHWSGFRVVPSSIEFWEDGAFRLHTRRVYQRIDGGWTHQELYP